MWRDFLNPWSALRAARRLAEMLDVRRKTAEASAEDVRKRWKVHAEAQRREIEHLRGLIAKAFFTDPATGRMTKRGEVPAALLPRKKDIYRDDN